MSEGRPGGTGLNSGIKNFRFVHTQQQYYMAEKKAKSPEKKGKLAEIKTKPTAASVEDFINTIKDEQKRKDSFAILEMMKKASGEEPKMWGSSLIGLVM